MIFIKDLAEISAKVGSTTRRKEKVSVLANFLKLASGKEIPLAASYLSGQIPQAHLGIGGQPFRELYRVLRWASTTSRKTRGIPVGWP